MHDVGAAKFDKEKHHITGAELATGILLRCGCSAVHIGAVARAIYSHRGSQNIPFPSVAAMCVAAADAKDHFDYVGELWRVADIDWGIIELQRHQYLLDKLKRDWAKIHPRIREMLDGSYAMARQTLLQIANGVIIPVERPMPKPLACTRSP